MILVALSGTGISKFVLLYKQIKFSKTNNHLLKQLHLDLHTLGLPECETCSENQPMAQTVYIYIL